MIDTKKKLICRNGFKVTVYDYHVHMDDGYSIIGAYLVQPENKWEMAKWDSNGNFFSYSKEDHGLDLVYLTDYRDSDNFFIDEDGIIVRRENEEDVGVILEGRFISKGTQGFTVKDLKEIIEILE